MIGFSNIDKLLIPKEIIEEVYSHLRRAGEQELECVALLAGNSKGSFFEIKTTVIPEQQGINHDGGLLYFVVGDELHRINVWLYRNNLSLIAQIHSHGGRAYHSDTDDRYPIVTTIGGISIVIPDFGFRPISITDWAVYRLSSENIWIKQNEKETNSLISII